MLLVTGRDLMIDANGMWTVIHQARDASEKLRRQLTFKSCFFSSDGYKTIRKKIEDKKFIKSKNGNRWLVLLTVIMCIEIHKFNSSVSRRMIFAAHKTTINSSIDHFSSRGHGDEEHHQRASLFVFTASVKTQINFPRSRPDTKGKRRMKCNMS